MAELDIGGRKVTVDDSFLQLPPEQQQATVEEISQSLAGQAVGAIDKLGRSVLSAITSVPSLEDVRKTTGNVTGQLLKGAPIAGAWAENLGAAAKSIPVGGETDTFGERYDKNLPAVRKQFQQFEKEHPWSSTALQTAGGVTSMAPLMMVPGVNVALGGAGGLPLRMALGGTSGGGINVADALARGHSPVAPGIIGAGIGVAAPAIGAAAGAGSKRVAEWLAKTPEEIADLSRGARTALTETHTPGTASRLAELGPEAFLFEGNPASFQLAQGAVAARPGPAQARMVDAVTSRDAGATSRLKTDVETNLGPYQEPGGLKADLERLIAEEAKRYPEAAKIAGMRGNAPELKARELKPILDQIDVDIGRTAGPVQEALTKAKGYFFKSVKTVAEDGSESVVKKVKTDIGELHEVRMALDDLYKKLSDTPRAQGAIAKLRADLDETMPRQIKDVDAAVSELHRQKEALDTGQSKILRTGPEAMTPDGLQAWERTAGADGGRVSPGQADKLQAGTRADIERLVGTNANDVAALRKAVGGDGDWNRAKLAQIFGQAEADRVIGAVDREVAFKDAYTKLVHNSQTAMRERAAKFVDETAGPAAPDRSDLTIPGAVVSAFQKAWKAASSQGSAAARARADDELARVLTTMGPERDRVVQALTDYSARVANPPAWLPSPGSSDRIAQLLAENTGFTLSRQPSLQRDRQQAR